MSDDAVEHDAEALLREGQSLRDALLACDLTEVRFCARQMATVAALLGFASVEAAAALLIDTLGPEGTEPRQTMRRPFSHCPTPSNWRSKS